MIVRRRAGFAVIKTVGSLGSFLGPALIGALADATDGFAAPCLLLAACVLAAAGPLLGFRAPGTRPADQNPRKPCTIRLQPCADPVSAACSPTCCWPPVSSWQLA